MSFNKKYESYLNHELFNDTPGMVKIKARKELLEAPDVDQQQMREIFQTGMKSVPIDRGSAPTLYFPIKIRLKVEAVLLLSPKNNMEEEFASKLDYLEKMADLGCKWAEESAEKEQVNKDYNLARMKVKRVFSTLTLPLCLVSSTGVIQEINDLLASMAGKRRTILLGERISQLLTPSSWERIQGVTRKGEIQLRLHDYREGDILATVQPITYEREIESYLIIVKKLKTPKSETKHRKLHTFAEIKGISEPLQQAIYAAKRVAKGDATIMLRGESGTGKELFAQSIHSESERKEKPFVTINCAAIPKDLLESELFGYEKGAFTGAEKDKPGRFEIANKGTIFLDEIGDMPLYLQAKILRVIQEKTIERIGSNKSIDIDVRIITATHQNLESLVKEEKFREDLYYRISVIPIFIPPLRERKEDLPILIEHYMREFSKAMKLPPKRLSEEALHKLLDYRWPGNIREMQNVVRHFVELEIGETVTLKSLPLLVFDKDEEFTLKRAAEAPRSSSKLEKSEIIHLLDRYGWHTEGKKKAASVLGVSLATLYRRMKKLHL
ncbi:sigma-54 interaction domain-containing protein [Bacillus salipaludis]|uniref:Sigma-54 interaction domain-containing protein n=1 Tax=Bacillus salipaludis TaxID=2547811 RepID=A0ABW8REM2_9BACI